MALPEDNLRIALLNTIAQAIEAELKERRSEHLDRLMEIYRENGSKSFEVRLPDALVGDAVGQIVLSSSTDKIEHDDVALLAWAKEHAPGMVKETVVPPMPEQRFEEIHPASLAALKKRVKYDKEAGIFTDGDVVVTGLKHKPGGPPKHFTVKLPEEGKARLMDAYRAGELAQVAAQTPVPQIGEERPPWES